jgi:hypothetical protein
MNALHQKPMAEIIRLLGNRARPEASWVARVVGCTLEQAERAINEILRYASDVSALHGTISRTGRSYYAQFPAPIELYAMVRLTRPEYLVESGVASGVSSAFLLLGVTANRTGILHSIDFPMMRQARGKNESWSIPSGLSSGWAIPDSLKRKWDLRIGRSEDLLRPLLDEIGRVDFFCHDSPVDRKHFEFEMRTVAAYSRPGSVVIADNIDRDIFEAVARSVGAKVYFRRKALLGAFRVPN